MKSQKPLVAKKEFTNFKVRVRSRHPSHDILRETLRKLPFRSVLRLGSETEVDPKVLVECNSIQAVKNSSSKFLMKQCFTTAGVITAPWWTITKFQKSGFAHPSANLADNISVNLADLSYPLIVKSLFGSRGRGNAKIDTLEQLLAWMENKDLKDYIFEAYKTYTREYRLHVTEDGCFYTCRKMLKRDTPDDKKFQRHDDNCVWILEDNEAFDKPVNWDAIIADCVKALASLGLDIGAFDLKVQSAKDNKGNTRPNPEWIVIESCSAPSFGEITAQRYSEKVPEILIKKAKKQGVIK